MGSKHVFIFYTIRDSGHHSAARALEKAFGRVDGEVDVSILNLVAYTNPIIERVLSNLFVQVMKKRPGIWGRLYNSDRNEKFFEQFTDIAYRLGTDKVRTLVDESAPAAIVCTQCLPCNMVDEYKRKTGSTVPLVAVVTDFFIPYYWICQGVDLYIVPDEEIMKDIVSFGVPVHKVRPLGIPIDPGFSKAVAGEAVRERMGLDPERPLVLLMGGGSGIGPLQEIARGFMEDPDDIQVIVITGKNNALKQRLRREKEKLGARHVMVLSYVKRLNELMEVADLVISKPGGLTLAESMAKGLPVIALPPLPGQEEKNMSYLIEKGLAYRADRPEEAVRLARELVGDREKLAVVRRKAMSMGKLNSAVDAAKAVMELIDAPVHSV